MPADLTVGQFVYVIRKRIKLSPEKAIFIFINNVLPPTGTCLMPMSVSFSSVASIVLRRAVSVSHMLCTAALMSNIYEEQKDVDGFLYITYSGENTFGQ